MNKKDEALKLALEALEYERGANNPLDWHHDKKIGIVREALAEQPAQQQEPVAVARVDDLERGGRVRALAMGLSLDAPLYTSPPAAQQQEPVARSKAYDMIDRFLQNNLNSDEDYAEYSKALDSIYTSPQPAQQQEPVYFCDYGYEGWGKVDAAMAAENIACGMTVEAYYASPQPSKPWVGLTDEEMQEIETATWGAAFLRPQSARDYYRAIEAKLREKNGGAA